MPRERERVEDAPVDPPGCSPESWGSLDERLTPLLLRPSLPRPLEEEEENSPDFESCAFFDCPTAAAEEDEEEEEAAEEEEEDEAAPT